MLHSLVVLVPLVRDQPIPLIRFLPQVQARMQVFQLHKTVSIAIRLVAKYHST